MLQFDASPNAVSSQQQLHITYNPLPFILWYWYGEHLCMFLSVDPTKPSRLVVRLVRACVLHEARILSVLYGRSQYIVHVEQPVVVVPVSQQDLQHSSCSQPR